MIERFQTRHRRRVLGAFAIEDDRTAAKLSKRRGLGHRSVRRVLRELEAEEAIEAPDYEGDIPFERRHFRLTNYGHELVTRQLMAGHESEQGST